MHADPDGLTREKWESRALQIHVNDARTRRRRADIENGPGELHVRLMLAHGCFQNWRSCRPSGRLHFADLRVRGYVRSVVKPLRTKSARPGGGVQRTAALFEGVLGNLAVQSAAADVEHACGFLLVPLHRVEHSRDVRAFGFGQ